MPMDVCHILLGRPWQYDRAAMHDGKRNTYKFGKDGVNHTLLPLQEDVPGQKTDSKTLLFGGKEYLEQTMDVQLKQEELTAAELEEEVHANEENDQLEEPVSEPTSEIVKTCSLPTDKLCMNAGDEMVTIESLACGSIKDCTESFSKEFTGLWYELSVLEQRIETQRISIQDIKTEMNGNKEVPEHRGILEADDVEERLTDSLKNDWDQHTEVLAVGNTALRPYDFYSDKCFVNEGIVAGTGEYLTQSSSQMKGEGVFCSRRQEGMDDRVVVRTETRIRERQQVTTGGDLQNKVWDPGGQEKKKA